jgi:hypothetical protein
MKYSEFMEIFLKSDLDDWIINDEYGTFVYKGDLSVVIKREEIDYSNRERFYEEWAEQFPDKNAYSQRYSLCYQQTIIEDFYTVAVDGMRSYIPYPKLDDMSINEFQYKVGAIVNNISGHSFDEYLKRARIKVKG